MDTLIPIIIVLLLFGTIGFGISYTFRRWNTNITMGHLKRKEEYEARFKKAIMAGGRVISVMKTEILHDSRGLALVRLHIEVNAPDSKPYSTNVSWLVDVGMLGQIQAGQPLSLKVDIDDPKRVYPNAHWADYKYY